MRASVAIVLLLVLPVGAAPASAQEPQEGARGLAAPPMPGGTTPGPVAAAPAPEVGPASPPPPSGPVPPPPPPGSAPPPAPSGPAYPVPPEPTPGPTEAPAPEPVRPNAVTADLFAQAAHYERGVADAVSLFAGVRLFVATQAPGYSDYATIGFGPELGLRLFFVGTAPEGFWVAPMIGFGMSSVDAADGIVRSLGWWTAALTGYTWVFPSGFVLSLGIGVQYYDLRVSTPDGDVGPRHVDVLGSLGLGWAF